MINLILLSVIFGSFAEAERNFLKTEKPLLIILTGNGCVPCEILKRDIIKPMNDSGELDKVDLVIVNRDVEDKQVVQRLTNRRDIPQSILLFKNKNNEYRKATLIGILQDKLQTKKKILELIKHGER